MVKQQWTDAQITELLCDLETGKCDAWPHVEKVRGLLCELKAERERIELLYDGVARLNSLLIWACDGLDEDWATLPENIERVKLVAEMFALKPK